MSSESSPVYPQLENIFRTIVNHSATPVGLYTGREMRITLANPAILKAWGKDASVIGKTHKEALPELDGQPFRQILDEVYLTGIAYEAKDDKAELLVDGRMQTFYFDFSYQPLKDAEGKVWGVLNTAADVTELVQMRKKLAESEERARFALQAADLGAWDYDVAQKMITWDDKCKSLYGFAQNEIIVYTDILKYIHPEDKERANKDVQTALNPASDGSYYSEFRIVSVDSGNISWLRCKGKAYFNDDGSPYRFGGTAQDTTDEISSKAEQQQLITVVENSPDMVGVADLAGNVLYLNKAGLTLVGAENLAEALRPAAEYFMEKDAAVFQANAFPAIAADGRWSGELNYRHFKTGEPIPCYLNAFQVSNAETGEPTAMAAVVRDLRPEKEAHNEQYKLLSLIEKSSDFVSLSDLDGNVSYVNTMGRKMLGLDSMTEALRHNSEYVTAEEAERLKNVINGTLFSEGRWTGQISYRHFKTGEAIPVYGTTMLVYNAATGKPQGRASIARDMRRELADKEALTESEQLLKNITTASPTALWMSDESGNITYVNQTWINWTGMSLEESAGSGWTGALIAEDRQRAADKFLSDLSARKAYEADFRINNQNGNISWCIATGNPQYDAAGEFTGYVGSCTDVTAQILAEKELKAINKQLQEQKEQFEFVTDFMPQQVWTATPDGLLDFVNKQTREYFGKTTEELVGPNWQNVVYPEDLPAAGEAWMNALQTGNTYQTDFRLQDKNGIYRWHLTRAVPFIIDGKIVKWFGTNTDIDEQKKLQRQKDEFLGIASHELKTPVTSIKAYTQVLGAMLTKEGEHKKAGMVIRMDAQINRLTNLIGDLLDVTKINSGRLQFNKTWFDFNDAVKNTIDDLQHTTKKHQLITEFTETGKIYADKDRIDQVLTNLITNAIKYSPHADKIIIRTKLHNNEVNVCVQDFGIGIPDDKKDRVFEQFYRVSGSKQHTFPGLGLGLYISSEIIKREGGRIWVESVMEKGSTFCFSLPIEQKD